MQMITYLYLRLKDVNARLKVLIKALEETSEANIRRIMFSALRNQRDDTVNNNCDDYLREELCWMMTNVRRFVRTKTLWSVPWVYCILGYVTPTSITYRECANRILGSVLLCELWSTSHPEILQTNVPNSADQVEEKLVFFLHHLQSTRIEVDIFNNIYVREHNGNIDSDPTTSTSSSSSYLSSSLSSSDLNVSYHGLSDESPFGGSFVSSNDSSDSAFMGLSPAISSSLLSMSDNSSSLSSTVPNRNSSDFETLRKRCNDEPLANEGFVWPPKRCSCTDQRTHFTVHNGGNMSVNIFNLPATNYVISADDPSSEISLPTLASNYSSTESSLDSYASPTVKESVDIRRYALGDIRHPYSLSSDDSGNMEWSESEDSMCLESESVLRNGNSFEDGTSSFQDYLSDRHLSRRNALSSPLTGQNERNEQNEMNPLMLDAYTQTSDGLNSSLNSSEENITQPGGRTDLTVPGNPYIRRFGR